MMNTLNAQIAENLFGAVAKLRLSSAIGTTEQCHNHGVETVEHAKEAKRTADTHPAHGMANLIAVHGMTAPAVMTKQAVVAYFLLSFSICLYI